MSGGREKKEVVIFVEDPGAANFVLGLPADLDSVGISAAIVAEGPAVPYLKARGISFHDFSDEPNLADAIFAFKPKVLLFGTSENTISRIFPVVDASEKQGVRTVGFLDSGTNMRFRFSSDSEDPLRFRPEYLLVPDQISAREAIEIGFNEKEIEVVGHPYFDWVLRRGDELKMSAPKFPPHKVLFLAEPKGGLNSNQFVRDETYSLSGSSGAGGRTEIVMEEFLLAVKPWRTSLELILRLHPKNDAKDFEKYHSMFDRVSHDEDLLVLMAQCDLVVGMTSMAMLEAALLGRPTLSIVPRKIEYNWLSSINWGATVACCRRSEINSAVYELLEKGPSGEIKSLRELIVRDSGLAVTRVVEKLIGGGLGSSVR